MEGVVTAVGHTLPSFAGFGGYGSAARRGPFRFAASSELVDLAQQALARLQNSIDVANDACYNKQSLDFWTGAGTLNWLLGNNTSTASVCAAAQSLQAQYDDFSVRVADSRTTDDTLVDILSAIHHSADVSDLLELAKATGGAAAAKLALQAPGAAIGAAGDVLGDLLGGILKNIPWWVWVGGAGYLAWNLGVFGGAARRVRERVA